MIVGEVFVPPRIKRNAIMLGAMTDGAVFPIEAGIEDIHAEMLVWAREHGGILKLRRIPGPFRSGMTVVVLVFDHPQMAFWFKMRWG